MNSRSNLTDVRSVLFVAGNALDTLQTPGAQLAHLWVLDLEDMVPRSERERALNSVGAFTSDLPRDWLERTFVRLSASAPTGIEDELELIGSGIGVVLPKTEAVGDVRAVAEWLRLRGRQSRIIATLETPRGILAAREILEFGPPLVGAIFGPSDLARSLSIPRDAAEGLYHARAHVALCAAASAVLPIDGGYLEEDDVGLEMDAIMGRRLGYRSKLTTRPEHVEVINRLFANDLSAVLEDGAHRSRGPLAFASRGSGPCAGLAVDHRI
jgi:citrate lyase beta subunit